MERKSVLLAAGNMEKPFWRSDCQRSGASRANLGIHPSPDKLAALHDQFGINAAESAQEVAQIADIIFAAVKLAS
ncbi:NAD(P)-binding domain-containing protein [Escherichia coli]